MIAGNARKVVMGFVGSLMRATGTVFPDFLFLLGGAIIVFGVHFWSVPAAWVVAGVLVIFVALVSAK